ncbi:hypothetical protein B296_00032999 [Ensete ventricosum]|uniref:Uncharacterized protein n=1 Tax=Ensete ventricosum TaxID=4639 RepID=A0A426YZU6_ENSVE|nr:hypothetical protein B296_00032999 [Ensete ventricosum]
MARRGERGTRKHTSTGYRHQPPPRCLRRNGHSPSRRPLMEIIPSPIGSGSSPEATRLDPSDSPQNYLHRCGTIFKKRRQVREAFALTSHSNPQTVASSSGTVSSRKGRWAMRKRERLRAA